MVTVIPFSSNQKKIPIHVAVNPPEGGLTMPSDAKCDQIRSISTERLKAKLGVLNPATVAAVEDKVRIVLGL
jgi:mRNA interferase MazF